MDNVSEDRTARGRIRDAAICCFADEGFRGTSVRTIASAAAVSPALILHHFGSKRQLKIECDEYVAQLIRVAKTAAIEAGTALDPLASFRQASDGPPVLRYLARTLLEDSPHVAELVDEMVRDAMDYLQLGEQHGTIQPTDDPKGRAAVLTIWSLGALVLHDHVERLLGAQLTDPRNVLPWARPAFEILGRGVVSPDMYRHLHERLSGDEAPPSEPAPAATTGPAETTNDEH